MFKYKLGDVTSILRPVFVARAVKGLLRNFYEAMSAKITDLAE